MLRMHLETHVDEINKCEIMDVDRKDSSSLETSQIKDSKGCDLTEYENVKEENEFPYTCNLCSEGFTEDSQLKMHIKTHDIYTCDVCGEDFSELDSFLNHRIEHNVDTGEVFEQVCDGKSSLKALY